MLEKIKKIKENKTLKIIGGILYWLLFAFVILVLLVVLLQRISGNAISLGGYRIFNIVSGSMKPKYEIGNVLLAKEELPENIRIGDDVVYTGTKGDMTGKIVTHAVLNVYEKDGKHCYITKGIANDIADPEITEDQICGVVIYKIKSLSLLGKLMTNLYAFYFCVFVPIVLIVYVDVRKALIARENRKNQKEEEE